MPPRRGKVVGKVAFYFGLDFPDFVNGRKSTSPLKLERARQKDPNTPLWPIYRLQGCRPAFAIHAENGVKKSPAAWARSCTSTWWRQNTEFPHHRIQHVAAVTPSLLEHFPVDVIVWTLFSLFGFLFVILSSVTFFFVFLSLLSLSLCHFLAFSSPYSSSVVSYVTNFSFVG